MYYDDDLIFCERRPDGTADAIVYRLADESQALAHVVRHSPTGFNWGYGGSGPADLALSMLTLAVGAELADRWYQAFKRERVEPETDPSWSIKIGTIREWVQHKQGAERADATAQAAQS